MTYKNKQLGTTILSEISNGAHIIDVLEETVNYMKVNRKSEQR
ncbi:type II secretion protein F, partial [Staphylococcus aureus]